MKLIFAVLLAAYLFISFFYARILGSNDYELEYLALGNLLVRGLSPGPLAPWLFCVATGGIVLWLTARTTLALALTLTGIQVLIVLAYTAVPFAVVAAGLHLLAIRLFYFGEA